MLMTPENNSSENIPFDIRKLEKDIKDAIQRVERPQASSEPESLSLQEVLKRVKELSPGELVVVLPSKGIFYPNKVPTKVRLRPPTGFDLERVSSAYRIVDLSKEIPEELKETPLFDPKEDWKIEYPVDVLLLSLIYTPMDVPSFPLEELVIADSLVLAAFTVLLTWGTSFRLTCSNGHSFKTSLDKIEIALLEEKEVLEEKKSEAISWRVTEEGLISVKVFSKNLRLDFKVPRLRDRGLALKGKVAVLLAKNLERVFLLDGDQYKEVKGSIKEKAELISLLSPAEYKDVAQIVLSVSGFHPFPIKYGLDLEKIMVFNCPICNKEVYFPTAELIS